ncbi:MAG: divergent polysaccharide deacetylase family protein [Proteobacteria bacterium]|nr:divergent polysaccharide deacetylase family protein [Pseudomonadota bacterium]
MASRRNRSGKSNRRSPNRALAWIERHRRALTIGAFAFLFLDAIVGGYWLAQRFEPPKPAKVTYARIEDIPGLPRYIETDPGQKPATVEDKPKQPSPQVAAAATSTQPPEQQLQTWQRNAVPFHDLRSKPLIAIVIDDVGVDRPHSKRAWELPGPLTLSFLPYARDLREQAKAAHAHGQELMLHLPMEPGGVADPGPNALRVSLSEAELKARVTAALDSFDGYVGVNNHMGSRFTAYRAGMETVLKQFRARGLLFLDSRTTPSSVGDQVAQELGVPSVARNVFLDDDEALGAVKRQLAETEAVARRQGFAVAIGHPHETTLQALAEWLPGVAGKGFALAPLSAVLRKRNGWD